MIIRNLQRETHRAGKIAVEALLSIRSTQYARKCYENIVNYHRYHGHHDSRPF